MSKKLKMTAKFDKKQIINKMKTNRIIGNVLEFLLLCGTVFLLLWILSKNIASHDYIILSILLIAYGITFLVNLILQTALLLNSEKTERSYFFAKTKLFAISLVLPVVLGTLIITLFWGDIIQSFFFFLISSFAVFVSYIGIVFILSLFDKFFIGLTRERIRIIRNYIIGIILIVIVISAIIVLLNKLQEKYWENWHTSNTESGKFVDKRDGKEYGWVKIGEQIWMSENLNYETPESRCFQFLIGSRYREEDFNSEEYCEKYGRLYLWSEAQCACPEGWELPSNNDWEILVKYTEWVASGKLTTDKFYLLLQTKNHWKHSKGNNATGFSAIPTKNFISDFVVDDYSTSWWTSSEIDAEHYRLWKWTMGEIFFISSADTETAFHSIRCIKKDEK
jgi:uncharacterized protein (TIGR02145 family)